MRAATTRGGYSGRGAIGGGPSRQAREGAPLPRKGDAKSGGENSPFGMMKFSADNGPIQIKADSLNLDYKNNSVEFKGTVHATQSGTTLTSKTLKVLYGAKFGEIKQVIALGDVKMTQGGRWATGQRAILDEVKHTVEMTGAPVIHDGPDSVAGRRIIIYLDTEKSYVEGASCGDLSPQQRQKRQRVRRLAEPSTFIFSSSHGFGGKTRTGTASAPAVGDDAATAAGD